MIGEDLGTVSDEIRQGLDEYGVLSYKVLYFMRGENSAFLPARAYSVQAVATVTTHDLPTLRGYWEGGDLTLGASLGVYPDPQVLEKLRGEREHSKQGLLDALHRTGCVPKSIGKTAANMPMTPVLNGGLQRYLAASASALLGLQPEDWLDMDLPVNVPGTNTEYPNWRRKLTRTLEEMFGDEHIDALLADLSKRRKG